MKPNKLILALMINAVIGLLFATAINISFPNAHVSNVSCILVIECIGVLMHFVNAHTGIALFDGLAEEVWLADVKEDFYPDSSFLSEATDLSSLCDNDAINLAEAGADPSVLVDNVTYPISASDAGDAALRMLLKTYDTTSTVVRNAVALELKYDQRMLYINKHKKALLNKFGNDAAYAYAPTNAVTALNPYVDGTGDAAGIILDRIIELQTAYNTVDAPTEGRILVLDPTHAAIIAKEDKNLYKSFEAGQGKLLFGFKIYTYSKNPYYVKSTNLKAAQGVAFNGSIHARSSFAFMKDEVMKSQGTFKFFSTLNDPANKGDVFNYQMRGLVSKIRNKYAGVIIK